MFRTLSWRLSVQRYTFSCIRKICLQHFFFRWSLLNAFEDKFCVKAFYLPNNISLLARKMSISWHKTHKSGKKHIKKSKFRRWSLSSMQKWTQNCSTSSIRSWSFITNWPKTAWIRSSRTSGSTNCTKRINVTFIIIFFAIIWEFLITWIYGIKIKL